MKKNNLESAINEVLHYIWDPIGIQDMPAARDEYESYAGYIFSMLINKNSSVKEVADYLYSIEVDHMGLSTENGGRYKKCESVAYIIQDWKEYLEN